MKTKKEISEMLAVLPGPLTQKDTANDMSVITKKAVALKNLAKKSGDTKLLSQLNGLDKAIEKLQKFISKLP